MIGNDEIVKFKQELLELSVACEQGNPEELEAKCLQLYAGATNLIHLYMPKRGYEQHPSILIKAGHAGIVDIVLSLLANRGIYSTHICTIQHNEIGPIKCQWPLSHNRKKSYLSLTCNNPSLLLRKIYDNVETLKEKGYFR